MSSSPTPEASPAPNSPPSPPATNASASPPAGTPTIDPISAPPPPNSGTPGSFSPLVRTPPKGSLPRGTLAALITGVGIGGITVLIAVGILVIFYRRRKRKREQGVESGGPPQGLKDDAFTGQPQLWQQNAPPPTEDKLKMLPKPTPPQQLPLHVPTPPAPPSMNSNSGSEKPLFPGIALGFSQSTFTYEELAMATNDFSDANLLGQGGFGYVHKGVLPNGRLVAIKQLKAGSGQGEREFQAEVEIISRVHHKHLVSLVGYCIAGAQRMLVYEFVPNNTLEFHLHGKGGPTMNWSTRMRIALGSAKGLAYLHEDCHPKIIHRDIKAANILVDYNFEAKVADFGLAKSSLDAETHISTRVMGTFGYLAPEYASSGKLTDKSDVFSFGVVLLELITGRRPIDINRSFIDDSMVEWARPLLSQVLQGGNFDILIDPNLQNDYDSSEMTRMVACAAACVRHSARSRPQMSQIVRALEGNISLDDLNEGIKPGHSTVYGNYGSSDYDTSQYKEDLEKFRKMALESQEQDTSAGRAPTGTYSMQPSSSSSGGQQITQEQGTGEGRGSIRESSLQQSSSSSESQQTTQETESEKTDKYTKDSDKRS